ncbi:AraC family transcriptional regulator [Kosakonia sp. ML.JS2a]|uniref:helix-turn-helix transcriptional regulator n=1 Tax=Kosakonia sp. ML.JS2a TaxID=2980557 RepID=UPI0021DA117A|nr:AraC family transcriptional regulator [Kosakonia sp. ML.JS2a]UXY11535.1 AraC family transcriptional regulator [Kosakonia sp. ML.JS2a]
MLIVHSERLTHQSRHKTEWHQHATGQLFCIQRGMMIVQTEHVQWALTPATIGWFPAHMRHSAWTVGDIDGISMQLDGDALSAQAGVWPADPFLLLLMERMTGSEGHRQQHLLAVMRDEIHHAPAAPLQLPLPDDRRARQVAEYLLLEPHSPLSQAQLASTFGMSTRTLSRLFSQQTGLCFSQWRQQTRILAAMGWLLKGASVSETAEQCGYENVSAFIAAFKQRFAMTPGEFRAQRSVVPAF